jgi:hypothetical protein
MAWDRRGYFYRSRRVGGRVVREYFGCGPLAEAAAHLLDRLKAAREGHALRAGLLDGADAAFRELHDRLDRAAAAHLLAAGYYRHDRGPWRRRRRAV